MTLKTLDVGIQSLYSELTIRYFHLKSLTNRIKLYISSVIQEYIAHIGYLTIFFNSGLDFFSRIHNLDIGFVSLDQEKAFEWVNHG